MRPWAPPGVGAGLSYRKSGVAAGGPGAPARAPSAPHTAGEGLQHIHRPLPGQDRADGGGRSLDQPTRDWPAPGCEGEQHPSLTEGIPSQSTAGGVGPGAFLWVRWTVVNIGFPWTDGRFPSLNTQPPTGRIFLGAFLLCILIAVVFWGYSSQ